MKKSTTELLELLSKSADFDIYMQQNQSEIVSNSLPHLLENLLTKKNINKSDCIEQSGLDRTYAYQILSGLKSPSRDKLVALCLGAKCNLEEVQTLLKHSAYPPLYPRTQRDCALIYSFTHSLSVLELNEILYELDEPIIK